MNKKQTKQVREAVREGKLFKIKSFLELVPNKRDYTLTSRYAKAWMTEPTLSSEQQVSYLVSKAILLTKKEDFYNSYQYLRYAYEDAVDDVQSRANERKIWQNLSERERSEIRLRSYSKASDEAENERENINSQEKIGERAYNLSNNNTEPQYDILLLKKLRGGIKYWQRQQALHPEKDDAHSFFVGNAKRFRESLDDILNEQVKQK